MTKNEKRNATRKLYADALMGRGISLEEGERYRGQGLAEFVGNQHNPAFRWRREKISMLSVSDLKLLYSR